MPRKFRYTNADDMEIVIDKYFKDCEGHVLTDENGEIVYNKNGDAVIVGTHPPTVTGLALALGFHTRQALINYQHRSKAFNEVLTIAKSRCEEYAEARLYDRDGVNGAKFSLANNFKGWRDKPVDDSSAAATGMLTALIEGLKKDD